MKLRTSVSIMLLGGAALLAGCNDTNFPPATGTPPPVVTPPVVTPETPLSPISRFVASLLAMITGSACDTALPASIDADDVVLIDDMDRQDANTLSMNCAS